jgi:hypothetical protein
MACFGVEHEFWFEMYNNEIYSTVTSWFAQRLRSELVFGDCSVRISAGTLAILSEFPPQSSQDVIVSRLDSYHSLSDPFQLICHLTNRRFTVQLLRGFACQVPVSCDPYKDTGSCE